MFKQTRIVDSFSHEGIHVHLLSDNNFIVNTDCCQIDTDNPEEAANLIDVLGNYEKKLVSQIKNCETLRHQLESEVADFIFTELQPPKWLCQTIINRPVIDFPHCDNCDEFGTHCHFYHPEDGNPIYLCDRCFAGETHE